MQGKSGTCGKTRPTNSKANKNTNQVSRASINLRYSPSFRKQGFHSFIITKNLQFVTSAVWNTVHIAYPIRIDNPTMNRRPAYNSDNKYGEIGGERKKKRSKERGGHNVLTFLVPSRSFLSGRSLSRPPFPSFASLLLPDRADVCEI